MEQLCAKTIYGGAPAGQHLGVWCSRGLAVQEGPEDDIEDDLFTVNAFTGVSFDPKRTVRSNADVAMRESKGTGEMKLDVTDDVATIDDIDRG
ncbi:hypothetical protein IMSHALPRED_006610 [Imshaugia aleurites]|uniref:Uncharacterized protein n=1 Tax=Imshaugia aleurites TaxID=172621 RepID=A0A8H3EMY6_9LECA|nr:hypothetical protein IMSHALPRED_006610 [Imshaugia aleurites]